MTKVTLVKGSHCFRCIHYNDYSLKEVPGGDDTMLISCAHDGSSWGERYGKWESGPERETCAQFEIDKKYLEMRRKLYGRE